MTKPRRLTFQGRVHASGVWIDPGIIGELEARRRVLRLADRAQRIVRAEEAYVVLFEEPILVAAAEEWFGTPLVESERRWSAAPLRADEQARVAAPSDSLLLVRGGVVNVIDLRVCVSIDLAEWIDLSDWQVIKVIGLGPAPTVAGPRLAGGAPPTGDVHELLGGALPKLSPERAAILAALRDVSTTGPLGAVPIHRSTIFERVLQWFARPPRPALPAAAGSPPSAPAKESWIRTWLARAVASTALSQAIGRRQSQYIEKTMQLFMTEQWDEALRHAIPFSSLPGAPRPPALSIPSPRAELELRAIGSSPARTSLTLESEWYERMRQLYRDAVVHLERAGRIEEAAYVLFELLDESSDGVTLLERHDKWRLAAQMAEGRGLEAGRIVRLWFKAGDPARAILVARRTGAFADAVERLHRSGELEASFRLRILWADWLAQSGEYAAAVDAIWPHAPRVESGPVDARQLAFGWIDRSIAFGGPVACRMLAKKFSLAGERSDLREDVVRQVEGLLEDGSEEGSASRRELGQAFASLGDAAAAQVSRLIARHQMLDAQLSSTVHDASLTHAHDGVLRYEVTGLPRKGEPPPPLVPASIRIGAHDRGLFAIEDAVVLPNGRIVAALGEAGLRTVDRHGKTLRAYEHPAHELVLADNATRAIVLTHRGSHTQLHRLDLVTGRIERWCDARFAGHADSFDGARWFVWTEESVACIDVQSPGFDALWRVGGLDAPVVALARSASELAFVLRHEDARARPVAAPHAELVRWTYELSATGPVLRHRTKLFDLARSTSAVGFYASVVTGPTALVVARQASSEVDADVVQCHGSRGVVELRLPRGELCAAPEGVEQLAVLDTGCEWRRLRAVDLSPEGPSALLEGSRRTRIHRVGTSAVVVDDRGRILVRTPDRRFKLTLLR